MRISWLDLQSTLNGALRCFGKGSVKNDENALGLTFDWDIDKNNVLSIRPDRSRHKEFFDLHAVEIERLTREAIQPISTKILAGTMPHKSS
jgi:hypothetical protein